MKNPGQTPSQPLSIPLSVFAWTIVVFATVFLHLFSLAFVLPISLLLDGGTLRLMHGVAEVWARMILKASLVWRLKTEGRENVAAGRPYVIIANHQSLADIIVCLAGIPVHFKFLAKKELFSIPFLGWHLAVSGYIPIDRASHESGKQAILKARQWLRRGVSVLFFPEGTRSPDGEIRDFKAGAFKIAAEEKVEILPVVIDGTAQAIPKHSWRFNQGADFFISVGKPVNLAQIARGSVEAGRDAVHKEMAERLARIRTAK